MVETRISKNSPVSFTLGANTYTKGVISIAGPDIQSVNGGDMVDCRTVATNDEPDGFTDFAKQSITIVLFDADVIPALLTAGNISMTAGNAALSACSWIEKNTAGLTRSVTLTASKCRIARATPKNVNLGDQTHEIKIKGYGTITYSSWA